MGYAIVYYSTLSRNSLISLVSIDLVLQQDYPLHSQASNGRSAPLFRNTWIAIVKLAADWVA